MENKVSMNPNPIMPNECVQIDPDLCTGCNSCVKVCRSDVLLPNKEEGGPPMMMYPDECWFCGIWKRKETGEYFRIGMKNPPPPNTKPPIC